MRMVEARHVDVTEAWFEYFGEISYFCPKYKKSDALHRAFYILQTRSKQQKIFLQKYYIFTSFYGILSYINFLLQ